MVLLVMVSHKPSIIVLKILLAVFVFTFHKENVNLAKSCLIIYSKTHEIQYFTYISCVCNSFCCIFGTVGKKIRNAII